VNSILYSYQRILEGKCEVKTQWDWSRQFLFICWKGSVVNDRNCNSSAIAQNTVQCNSTNDKQLIPSVVCIPQSFVSHKRQTTDPFSRLYSTNDKQLTPSVVFTVFCAIAEELQFLSFTTDPFQHINKNCRLQSHCVFTSHLQGHTDFKV